MTWQRRNRHTHTVGEKTSWGDFLGDDGEKMMRAGEREREMRRAGSSETRETTQETHF